MSRRILFIALSMFLLVGCGDDSIPEPAVVEELSVHEKKAGADATDAWIIIQDGEVENRLAVFVGLDEQIATLKPDSEIHIDERLNLYLRQKTEEGWTTIKGFEAQYGDYIVVTITENTVTGFSYH